MAKLFPFRPERKHDPVGPRLVNLDDDAAPDVFAALSSETARRILSRLYEGPATASDVAEAVDTSLQNARYHLDKLETAGMIEPIDTWYSSRGTEMTVYGPTNEPLVIAAGDEESHGVLRRALERLVGAVAILAVGSVFIDLLVRRFGGFPTRFTDRSAPQNGPDVNGVDQTNTPSYQATAGPADTTARPRAATVSSEAETNTTSTVPDGPVTPSEQATSTDIPTTASPTPDLQMATDGGIDLLTSIPPGVLFFAGGLAVVLSVSVWWYWRQYKPLYG